MPTHDDQPAWPSEDQDPDEPSARKDAPEHSDEGSANTAREEPKETSAAPQQGEQPTAAKDSGGKATQAEKAEAVGGAVKDAKVTENAENTADAADAEDKDSADESADEKPKASQPEASQASAESKQPEKPRESAAPEKRADSEKATEAAKATEPEKSAKSGEPEKPAAAAKSEKPADSGEAAKSGESAETRETPATDAGADSTAIMRPISLFEPDPRQKPRQQPADNSSEGTQILPAVGRAQEQPPQGGRPPVPPAASTHAQPMRIDPSGEVRPAGTRQSPGQQGQTGWQAGAPGQGPGAPAPRPGPVAPYPPYQPNQLGQQGQAGQTGQQGQYGQPGEWQQPQPAEATAVTEAVHDTGSDPGAETATEPRRKKRGLVLSGSALLVVILVGVALAIPYVSNHLGLPWAPNFPKADEPEPAAVTLDLKAPDAAAPTPAPAGVSSALAGPSAAPALGTLAGIVIDPATGSTLWDHNSTQLLTPASATKLLTTSAALLKLDHSMQLSTKVVQGSSPDTAVIVAGGDPTLSSLPVGKDSVYPGAAHLDQLVAQVKQASGGTIKRVQLDSSLYSGAPTAPGWSPEDTPSTYAVNVVPGMLDAGRSDPTVNDVARTPDPGGALLHTFAQRLGVSAAGSGTAPQDAKVLGEVKSAPITELVDNALQISDNNLAEAIGRQTAIAAGAPPTFAGVAQTTLNVLAQNGFDISGVQLNDGSGLSTLNKVSPKLLAQLLTVAAAPDDKDPRTAKLRPLLEGLPVAGGSGTLADRYNDPASSAGKGWVRAKTGTLSGVNTLAGLVLDADGRVLVFAMMSNGSDINAARPALDAVTATLRGCGCR